MTQCFYSQSSFVNMMCTQRKLKTKEGKQNKVIFYNKERKKENMK